MTPCSSLHLPPLTRSTAPGRFPWLAARPGRSPARPPLPRARRFRGGPGGRRFGPGHQERGCRAAAKKAAAKKAARQEGRRRRLPRRRQRRRRLAGQEGRGEEGRSREEGGGEEGCAGQEGRGEEGRAGEEGRRRRRPLPRRRRAGEEGRSGEEGARRRRPPAKKARPRRPPRRSAPQPRPRRRPRRRPHRPPRLPRRRHRPRRRLAPGARKGAVTIRPTCRSCRVRSPGRRPRSTRSSPISTTTGRASSARSRPRRRTSPV